MEATLAPKHPKYTNFIEECNHCDTCMCMYCDGVKSECPSFDNGKWIACCKKCNPKHKCCCVPYYNSLDYSTGYYCKNLEDCKGCKKK